MSCTTEHRKPLDTPHPLTSVMLDLRRLQVIVVDTHQTYQTKVRFLKVNNPRMTIPTLQATSLECVALLETLSSTVTEYNAIVQGAQGKVDELTSLIVMSNLFEGRNREEIGQAVEAKIKKYVDWIKYAEKLYSTERERSIVKKWTRFHIVATKMKQKAQNEAFKEK